ADGRNPRLQYTVPADGGGQYQVRLLSAAGGGTAGDYTLSVAGATGSVPEVFNVTDSSLAPRLNQFPDEIDVEFSGNVLLSTAAAGDLTVNGAPASGVSFVDGRTLRFDVASLAAGETDYVVEVSA